MSPYREPAEMPKETGGLNGRVWRLEKFQPLKLRPHCSRCGEFSGTLIGKHGKVCNGRRIACIGRLACPTVPHFHVSCIAAFNVKCPCGHSWLMATADAPEARDVFEKP